MRELTQASFQSPSRAVGLAFYGRRLTVAVTSDGGHSWQAATTPAFDERWYNLAVRAWPMLDAIWGPKGLFLSSDHGSTWRRSLPGVVGQVSVWGTDVWATVATCGRAPASRPWECPARLEVSADGGRIWTTRSRLPIGVIGGWGETPGSRSLVRTSPSDAYLLDASGAGTVLLTRDGGRTWAHRAAPCPRTLRFMNGPFYAFAARGRDVWLACGGEPGAGSEAKALYVSTDSAITWRRVATTQGGSGALPQGYLSGLDLTGGGGAYLELSRYPLQHTNNDGHTWSDAASGAAGRAFEAADRVSLTTIGPERAWVLLDAAPYLWTTDDGGARWTPITPG